MCIACLIVHCLLVILQKLLRILHAELLKASPQPDPPCGKLLHIAVTDMGFWGQFPGQIKSAAKSELHNFSVDMSVRGRLYNAVLAAAETHVVGNSDRTVTSLESAKAA